MSAVTNDTQERVGGTALLLLGGGARAAYSVGFLRCLGRRLPQRCDFTVIAGVSSGAINAAFLASRPGTFQERVAALADLWQGLEPSSVMDVRTVDLLKKMLGWGAGLVGGGSACQIATSTSAGSVCTCFVRPRIWRLWRGKENRLFPKRSAG